MLMFDGIITQINLILQNTALQRDMESDSQSGSTLDIKIDRSGFQCDVTHQWIAQQRSALCLKTVDCHVLCLRHAILVWRTMVKVTLRHRRHYRDITSNNVKTHTH